jgi:hypothetical protein
MKNFDGDGKDDWKYLWAGAAWMVIEIAVVAAFFGGITLLLMGER